MNKLISVCGRYLLLPCLMLATQVSPIMAKTEKPRQVKIADLAAGQSVIVGKLGVPIGTVVEVTGELIRGEDYASQEKWYKDVYLLNIKSLDGRPVALVPMWLSVGRWQNRSIFSGKDDLADHMQAWEIKRAPTPEELIERENNVLRRPVTCYVYEEVFFSGVPDLDKMPPGWIVEGGRRFGPWSKLRVLHVPKS